MKKEGTIVALVIILIIVIVIMTGTLAFKNKCTGVKHKNYIYYDKVVVVSGFYKGRMGIVMKKSYLYSPNYCSVAAYIVKLDLPNTHKNIKINQDDLKLKIN
ncbi:unnamed protein product [marine sediment metagenome]|uniref:Uncharacterized protein n=1 Tax=marine sediment metagenome TaxID=412755 RepID=X0SBH4_9ZZZZ